MSDIETVRDGALLHIEIARPAKRNALSAAMYATMADALVAAETSAETRIVLISGAGATFCAGNDLADFVADRPEGEDTPVMRFKRAISTSTRILIAAVQGRAIGIGTTMLLHCDFVIAEEDAQLQTPFVDLAIVPELASSLLLPRLIGQRRAAELLLLGEPLSAARAEALGLVNRVVAAGQALPEARALAARLAAKPASALLAAKRLMKSSSADPATRMAEEDVAFAAQLKTPELAAIIAGFFAARANPASRAA